MIEMKAEAVGEEIPKKKKKYGKNLFTKVGQSYLRLIFFVSKGNHRTQIYPNDVLPPVTLILFVTSFQFQNLRE